MTNETLLKPSDFATNQEVRWCPGCGDYAILAAMQRFLPSLNIPRENLVFISGIGCSGRFPYYMNTYGFHTIHGRAPTIATGLKITRPELSIWMVTGDGDGLSIGGNHLLHILRRNVDVKILLLNNRIYGLTKGQYSPTSELGKQTNTSPHGTLEQPINPIAFALAAGATFVARGLDIDSPGLQELFQAAAAHRGTAFIEIYQNCNIFNDGAFANLTDKKLRAVHSVKLKQDAPSLFGANQEKALQWNGKEFVVTDYQAGVTDCYQHDARTDNLNLAFALSQLTPDQVVPFGIFRQVSNPDFASKTTERKTVSEASLQNLLQSKHHWQVN